MRGRGADAADGLGGRLATGRRRARRPILTKGAFRNIKLMMRLAFALLLLIAVATLRKMAAGRKTDPERPRGTGGASGQLTSGAARRGGVDRGAAGSAAEGADSYQHDRGGKIAATWHPPSGPEVDAWDRWTQDPRANRSQLGDLVRPAPQKQKYWLSAVIVNRVWSGDEFGTTLYECRQWLEYMRYAGVEHVFWYDTARSPAEPQERGLRPYSRSGFVTFHRFAKLFPGTLHLGHHFVQDKSLAHCLTTYGLQTRWLAPVSIDEYIFVPPDPTPGFLDRYMRAYEDESPDVSQMLLQCLTFEGPPSKPLPALLVERYQKRTASTEGVAPSGTAGRKAIVRPRDTKRVYRNDSRHFEMHTGRTVAQPAENIRLNRYWGTRRLNGSTSAELSLHLVEDTSMQPIAEELKQLLHFGRGSRGLNRG